MAKITAADVKKLREMTGAGMMDCKKALAECDGDLDASVDFLRKKGLAAASKKSGRVAAEGIVVAVSKGNTGVLLEVNAETDFVSKNDQFRNFVDQLADLIIENNPADIEALNALQFNDEYNVEQALSQLIATIGENMNIRRFERLEADVISAYVHGAGKIGVLIAVNVDGDVEPALEETVKGIAMHVAAVNPLYVSREDVPTDAAEREKTVLTERAQASGKPENIIEKIVTGQMARFYSENCLLEQDFVIDSDVKVAKALEDAQKGASIKKIARFQLGEGIEKKEENFAEEVAAQIKGA